MCSNEMHPIWCHESSNVILEVLIKYKKRKVLSIHAKFYTKKITLLKSAARLGDLKLKATSTKLRPFTCFCHYFTRLNMRTL